MKNVLTLFLGAFLLNASPSQAQRLNGARQYLDINQIKALNMMLGHMWYDDSTMRPAFEFPKGSGKHASYAGGLWASSRDANDSLYAAATLFTTVGADFRPGTLNDTGFCTPVNSEAWSKIWKVSYTDILAFKALSTRTTASVPADILTWPAKGNIYAVGGFGMSLTITEDMAPFEDVNGDNIYNALDGDYPKIKGDQMLWWVINDNTTPHYLSKGKPMKLEYRISAYGYSRGTDVDRIVFYEYDIRNKSAITYETFRFGFFSDADLGSGFDDYLAFDSTHRMGIEYNAVLPDGGYGYHPPIAGYTLIEAPGDVYPSGMKPAGSFNTFEGSSVGRFRDPRKAIEFENYMKGNDADGNPVFGSPYRYNISRGKEMCDSMKPMADRRFVINTGDYKFVPGARCKMAFAVVLTDTIGYDCSSIVNFDPILKMADTAWEVYYNPLKSLNVQEWGALDKRLSVYPNPAYRTVFMQSLSGRPLRASALKVFDVLGRSIELSVQEQSNGLQLSVERLAAGTYYLLYEDAERKATAAFTKQ